MVGLSRQHSRDAVGEVCGDGEVELVFRWNLSFLGLDAPHRVRFEHAGAEASWNERLVRHAHLLGRVTQHLRVLPVEVQRRHVNDRPLSHALQVDRLQADDTIYKLH